ncbi:MAG TPA: hypothetical protein VJZ06_07165 [Mobilitalea sp.]|nr:hypothetical protein [Mobilitalea sp.]
MKKYIFSTILLLLVLGTAGCTKKEIFLTAEEISTNTMLIKRNGELQVAIVEDFDKTYYNLNELEEFVSAEINVYNQKVGSDEVTLEDLKLNGNKAVMLLHYSGMAHYSAFNNVTAAYFGTGTKDITLELPAQFVNDKNGDIVKSETAMGNEKYKVLVVYEPYNIIIDGSIKYYSQNATKDEDKNLRSSDDGATVVIYRPSK